MTPQKEAAKKTPKKVETPKSEGPADRYIKPQVQESEILDEQGSVKPE